MRLNTDWANHLALNGAGHRHATLTRSGSEDPLGGGSGWRQPGSFFQGSLAVAGANDDGDERKMSLC